MRWAVLAAAGFLIANGPAMAQTAAPAAPVETAAPAGSSPKAVSLRRLVARIAVGTPWAKLQTAGGLLGCIDDRTLTWTTANNETIQDPEFERVFRQEITGLGFRIAGDPTNLFEEDSKSADLQVGGLVTALQAKFCATQTVKDRLLSSSRVVIKGEATMAVEWQIYSTSAGKVLARIPTSQTYATPTAVDGGNVVALTGAFAANVRALATAPEFRRIVLEGEVAPAMILPSTAPLVFTPGARVRRTPAQAGGSVALVFAGSAMGSAFLVSNDGYLLTNHHVVGDATQVRVRWPDQSETVGQVVRIDRRRDVALIKADPGGRPALPLRTVPPPAGDTVFAIGTPLKRELQGTITRGVVSAVRTLDGQAFIQSDVVINSGNSGGPLLDDAGAVVGITVSGYEISGAPVGINLFIPIAEALRALVLTPTGAP